MKKLKLASHNSFTYMKPAKWYMRPFNFMSRCQSENIIRQYTDYNVRIFDLRVAFDRKGKPFIRHGLMDYGYKGVENALSFLDLSKEKVYVRVILERGRREHSLDEEKLFVAYCRRLQDKYINILFLEGVRKYDWGKLFDFGTKSPSMEADFSSVKGSKLKDLWPRLYARKHNGKAIKSCKAPYLMLDFVEIQ